MANEKCVVVPGICRVHLIPKVASATLYGAFKNEKRHLLAPAQEPGGEFRWAVIRHPLDRLVSLYTYFTGAGLNGQPQVRKLGYYERQPFEEFAEVLFEKHDQNIHTRPQSVFVGDHEAHLADYDRFEDEWRLFRARFPGLRVMRGLPRIHETKHAHWEGYYTPEMRKRAEDFYAQDMTLHERATRHGTA